jgi:Ni,Fe-hydrogenase maturation factor
MKVSVFGNPDLKGDSLVVKMVPRLKKRFPEVEFKIEDPSEGLKPPVEGEWIILDVAVGIDKVRVFEDLDKLVTEKRVSLHDYDVAMELKLLKKLGKIGELKIVAVPVKASEEEIVNKLDKVIDEK